MEQNKQAEQLLSAWVKLTGFIKNSRITKGLAYNEAVIMMLLYNRYREDGIGSVSIKEITAESNMLKSLVNRTINSLESKGLLKRCANSDDKRMAFVRCVEERLDTCLEVHKSSLELARQMIAIIGPEDADAFIRITRKIAAAEYKL